MTCWKYWQILALEDGMRLVHIKCGFVEVIPEGFRLKVEEAE